MTTLQQFSLEATRKYLQTVVFVDDKIFDDTSGMAVQVVDDLPKGRKRIYEPEKTTGEIAIQVDSEEVNIQDSEDSYRPKDLVTSFAREGIICALYEPPEEFQVDPTSDIFKLCERPDIIILDWDLSGDAGQKTLDLILALVKQSQQEFPYHIRLLVIYTIDPSLVGVANQIGDRLTKNGLKAEPDRSPFRIQSEATRIIVFGKDKRRIAEEVEFTVKERDLAVRLIEEFAEMNSGILPAYALHGMAAIRRNSKRILERFHGDLNGAFLLHRALSKESEEAFDQLHELLADELQAVLDDAHLTPDVIADVANDAISNLKLSPPSTDWRYTPGGRRFPATHYLSEAVVREMLSRGQLDRTIFPAVEEVIEITKPGFSGIGPDLMQALLIMVDSKKSQANQRLASLFAVRTQYDQGTRRLYHGSIIRRRNAEVGRWIYSFCVMPVCDSIRLDRSMQFKKGQLVRFPFWNLNENVLLVNQASRRGITLLPPGTNEYLLVSAGGKSRDMLWLAGFQIDEARGQVVSEKSADGRFLFASDQDVEIEWVAELKPLHAQRIAHDIGQNLSRVGLIEAEWLRLLCER